MNTKILFKLSMSSFFFLLFACTNPLSDILSADEPDAASQGPIPTQITLTQNYPNPFNGSTNIAFRIPAAMNVRINLYTEEWEFRETLLDKNLLAGSHIIFYQAENLPAGEYYYTMQAGGLLLIRKMKCIK
jgi:hypothetical protein